jgi:hypothetical protein
VLQLQAALARGRPLAPAGAIGYPLEQFSVYDEGQGQLDDRQAMPEPSPAQVIIYMAGPAELVNVSMLFANRLTITAILAYNRL